MNNSQSAKLSFFESIYIWIYVYTIRYKFLSGRGPAEGPPCVYLAFLQFCNYEVIWRSIILIFDLDIPYSVWIDVGVFVGFTIFNTIVYEKNLDTIVERHNALPENKRLRNRTKMLIYVVISFAAVLGLIFYVSCSNEAKKIEPAKETREILRSNRYFGN